MTETTYRYGLATIITDASLCSDTGAGGWAGRVITNGKRYTFSGPLKIKATSSTVAELAAVCNTLHCAFREGVIEEKATLLFQIDNVQTIQLMETAARRSRESKGFGKDAQKAMRLIVDMINAHGGRIVIRHVKAHKKRHEREARHHVHEVLDGLAKNHMRARREELKGQGHGGSHTQA